MSESDTPRTDQATWTIVDDNNDYHSVVWPKDMAEMERENNRLKMQLEEAMKTLEEIDGCSEYPNIAGVALDRIKQLSDG